MRWLAWRAMGNSMGCLAYMWRPVSGRIGRGQPRCSPLNDHRLVEAFRVSGGQPVRGRFDINNPSSIAWSGVLSSIIACMLPTHGRSRERLAQGLRGHTIRRDARLFVKINYEQIWVKDVRWKIGLLDNINFARGTERFAGNRYTPSIGVNR